MRKAVYHVMLITIVAKILGFGREILLSYYFGAGGISDAYLISQTIPGTIFQFVGTGLATSFIPVYMRVKSENGREKADYFSNTVLTVVLLFSTIAILVVWGATEPVVKLFANGFTGETLQYAVMFTRIGILSLYFSAIIYVFNSYLQANGVFSIVAFVAIPNSIAIMGAIIAGARLHIMALPVGSLLAVLLQLLILCPAMARQKYRLRLNWGIHDTYVKEIVRLMIPVIIGVSVNQINVLVDRTIASQIAVGGISALTYADSLIMFIQGIFSQSIATVYYPPITQLVEEKKENELKNLVSEALESMAFILIPVMVGCLILGTGIVQILYGRGAFDREAIRLTGTALSLYGVGIVGYGFREILSRVYYAYHNTKTPMINAMIGMALNIVLNLAFSRILGIGGLALATSASSIATAILLYLNLKKRTGGILRRDAVIQFPKMIFAAAIMGVAVLSIYKYGLPWLGNFVSVVCSVAAGVVVYFALAKLLRITVYTKILDMVKNKLKRRSVE